MTRRAVRAAILIAIPWGIAGAACGKQFNDEPAPPEGQRLITGKLYPPAVRDLAEQAVALQLAAVAIDGREDDPITAFAARQDEVVYADEVREWAQHTDGGFELIEVDGDHWFLNRNRELITAAIRELAGRYQRSEANHVVPSVVTVAH